jgi:hypothetical protein
MMNTDANEPLHCAELVTGKSLTGTLHLTDERLKASIVNYDEFFHINVDAPVYLVTENNHIVSLHSNVGGSAGHTSRNIPPERSSYRQEIISNIAVVGHDAWTLEDRVKRVTFTVKHTDDLMRNAKRFDTIFSTRWPSEETWRLFKEQCDGMVLEAYYGAQYTIGRDVPQSVWPSFAIEFDCPCTIHDYIKHVSRYVQFLSFCLGAHLKPSDIQIDRLSFEEMHRAIEEHTYPGSHKVQYVWPEADIDPNDLWVGGSPVRAWDDHELEAFCACLKSWMDRSAKWDNAYDLMMGSYMLQNVISSERLVNACRWLEEIPLAAPQQAISADDIDKIVAAAASVAEALGYSPEIRHRLSGSLKRIKSETAEAQFSRLCALVRDQFGERCLRLSAVSNLKQALQFRGRTAHGHLSPSNDEEFLEFARSIAALEALCALLTAYDLPITHEGLERILHNRPIAYYRNSH